MLHSISLAQGVTLSSFQDISSESVRYFSTLFSNSNSQGVEEETIIMNCIHPLVFEEMNNQLMSPISMEEVEKVVFQMKKGKSLGPNGFLDDFFRIFGIL